MQSLVRTMWQTLGSRAAAEKLAGLFLLLFTAYLATPAYAFDVSDKPLVVRSGQEAAVLRLLAPWQEGERIAGDVRWVGTRIDKERICFVLKDATEVDGAVCLVPVRRAAALFPGRVSTAVSSEIQAFWDRGPNGAEDSNGLTQILVAKIRTATTGSSLAALWSKAEAEPPQSEAVPVQRQTPWFARSHLPLGCAVLVLLWLLYAAVGEARTLPGSPIIWIGGLALTSVLLRLFLAPWAPMDAWSWTRTTDVGLLLLGAASLWGEEGVWFGTAQAGALLVVSSLTPVAVFCHASRLFRDARVAMAAAAFMALSPHHIRFSAAATQFTPSLFMSSLAFYWIYLTTDSVRPIERVARLSVLPSLLWLTFTMRPLNVFFAPLMVAALVIAARLDAKAWRVAIACVVGGTAAALVLPRWREYVGSAPGTPTDLLWGAEQLVFRADWNPLTFWRLTPPAWLPLILAGALIMWKSPWPTLSLRVARARGAWLIVWLVGFVALHGVVVVSEPMNNARYQLHSLPAMAMLAAAGAVGLWWHPRGRPWALAAAVPVVLAPWLHADSIRDVGYDVMRERAFLESLRDDPNGPLPPDCQIIELMRSQSGELTSRFDNITMRVGATQSLPYWRRVVLQPEHSATSAGGEPTWTTVMTPGGEIRSAPLVLVPDAAARLGALKGCVAFYEGPECTVGPGDRRRHPACAEVLATADWQLAAEQRFAARIYDQGLSDHLHRNGEEIALRLWRRRIP